MNAPELHKHVSCGNTHGTGMSNTYPPAWEAKVAFMRARGITSATWISLGETLGETLGEVTLGPLPSAPSDDDTEKTQPSISPQQRELNARAERRRISLAASGGPVPRLSDD